MTEARLKVVTMIFVALGLAAALPAYAVEQQFWTGQYPLAPGSHLAVENLEGNIRVEGWDRAQVEITAIKTSFSPGTRLDDVRVALELSDHALAIRTVYFGRSKEPVRVDYYLRVPRQVRVARIRTVDGDITVRNIEGSMDARNLHGNIAGVELTGRVVAHATNGSIAVSLRALPDPGAPLRLETLNGNVDLLLPSEANADLELSTVAGRIEGNYVFVASTVPGDNTRRARLGRGGVLVSLRTVRGNIRLAEREDLL